MKLISAGASVNFEEDGFQTAISQSDEIELNQTATPLIELTFQYYELLVYFLYI